MALITFTSNFGSGGESIARNVSAHLGVPFYDDLKLQERALAIGVSGKEIESLDEKAPGFFDRLFTKKPAIYLDLLGAVVLDVAGGGEGVIIGHGAQVFLKDFNCALHVMVHASEQVRGQWLAKAQNISADAATVLVRKMDKRLKEFVQYAFDRDWSDPAGYDLVLNLDKIGSSSAEKLIIDLAGSSEAKECSLNALEEMEFSSLKRQIDAAIIKHDLSTPFTQIVVTVTGKGQVHLSGWTHSGDALNQIVAVVSAVPGVSNVSSDMFVMPSGY